MIIQGAFLKLPELLLNPMDTGRSYEATVNSQLAMAVLLELNARNIPSPMHRIHLETRYPGRSGMGFPGRADMLVDLSDLAESSGIASYGWKDNNWLEAKLFGGLGHNRGTQPRVANLAKLARDLLRLCLFVPVQPGEFGKNGRYFLAVFNRAPEQYLAFTSTQADRSWVRELLTPGRRQIEYSLAGEVKSFVKPFQRKFKPEIAGLRVRLDCTTRSFSPIAIPDDKTQRFWGYLVQVNGFRLSAEDLELDCLEIDQLRDDSVASRQAEIQERMLVEFLATTEDLG